MTAARLVVGLSVCLSALVLAQTPSEQALAVYEQGKALYDAKDYGGALAKFDEAAALEPTKARWHYNRGLALRKLGRTGEAKAALLESRRLEPDYKRAEIDEKLSDLGGGGTDFAVLASSDDFPLGPFLCAVFGFIALVFGVIFAVIRFLSKASSHQQEVAKVREEKASIRAVRDETLSKRVRALARELGSVEHGLSLGEDATARGHADRAATNLASVRKALSTGRLDDAPAALERAQSAINDARERLVTLHGERALSTVGPRAGCFFCARAIPTPAAGLAVQLGTGGTTTTVVACPTCARRVAAGQPPGVLTVGGVHWAESDDFNPYVHAHAPPEHATEVPAWKAAGQGSALGTLATIAGGAVLGGLGAAAVGRLLDLDATRQADLASEAAAASARAASSRRSTEYQDHS